MKPHSAPTKFRELDSLPGPRGLPWFGNSLQIRSPVAHRDVEQWARQYGPFFRFRLGRNLTLGVTDHEVIGTVLRERPNGFRRTKRIPALVAEMGLAPGLFVSEGQAWRDQRRMVMAGFAPGPVKAYFDVLLKVTQRLRGRWLKAAQSGIDISLQSDLMRYTVDGVAGLAFGRDMNTLESDEEVIQQHLNKVFPKLFKRLFSPFPYWRYVRMPADRQLDRSVTAINEAIAGFIATSRERMRQHPELREHPSNLLEAMIVAADLGDSGVDDKHVAGNVLTMLLAGEDTTANTLTWMIYLLYTHPQVLLRAREEVLQVAGHDPAAFTFEKMNELPYLAACASETMRLKPVAPFIVVQSLQDTTIADIRVPAGTFVWCVMRHDAVNEQYFPNPKEFNPLRWLKGEDTGQAVHAPKNLVMPFGAGPRICPGRYLALLEIKMAIAMLLCCFDIERVFAPGGGVPKERMSFAMGPIGLRMRLQMRS